MPGIPHQSTDAPARRHRSDDSELRVVIVDDEELFRSGLRSMLEVEGLRVIAEASRPEEALELVPCSAPDVVVLSLWHFDARHHARTRLPRRRRVAGRRG